MKDENHKWLYGNDAFSALLGKSRPDYYGKDDLAIFPEKIAKAFFESDDTTFKAKREIETEEDIVEPSGLHRTILTKKTPFTDPNGNLTLVGIIRDITDRKHMERQLQDERARQISASRLASLGEMAGGIAHEINNPLAIISGYTARLTDVLTSEPFARDRAQEIVRRVDATTNRIATIIKGLRAISRDGGFDPKESASVETITNDTLGLCSEKFRNSGVTIETDLEPNLRAYCRQVQISQVLLNLLTNAFFAVYKFPNAKIQVQAKTVGDCAEISVTDSGPGIEKALRERIFEPFFTTKPVGQGTGLGLSIASSIVREHDGELILDPLSPATRFVIRLPIRKTSPDLQL
jgi:PAS domain S-box-containing protein